MTRIRRRRNARSRRGRQRQLTACDNDTFCGGKRLLDAATGRHAGGGLATTVCRWQGTNNLFGKPARIPGARRQRTPSTRRPRQRAVRRRGQRRHLCGGRRHNLTARRQRYPHCRWWQKHAVRRQGNDNLRQRGNNSLDGEEAPTPSWDAGGGNTLFAGGTANDILSARAATTIWRRNGIIRSRPTAAETMSTHGQGLLSFRGGGRYLDAPRKTPLVSMRGHVGGRDGDDKLLAATAATADGRAGVAVRLAAAAIMSQAGGATTLFLRIGHATLRVRASTSCRVATATTAGRRRRRRHLVGNTGNERSGVPVAHPRSGVGATISLAARISSLLYQPAMDRHHVVRATTP